MAIHRGLLIIAFLCFWSAGLADQPPVEWIRHMNSPDNRADAAFMLALGPGGTVTVTGISDDINGIEDISTIRYDALGNVVWSQRYDGDENWIDVPKGLGVDAAGNTYVVGSTWAGSVTGGGSDWDYVLLKYRTDGTIAWTRTYNGPGNWSDVASSIAVDPQGNSYVGGFAFVGPSSFGFYASHFHIAKYDTQGELLWEVLYDIEGHHGAGARDVRIAPDGNIVATGPINVVEGGSIQSDIVTLKVSPQGQILWARQWNSPGANHGLDDVNVVRNDRFGNIFVLGSSFADEGDRNFDSTLLKYAPDGTFQWVAFMDFDRPDGLSDLVDDEFGNVYLSGGWENELGNDGFIVSFAPDGAERWRYVFDGAANSNFQEALSIMRGPDGLLYVGLDWQHEDADGYDFTVAVHDTMGNPQDLWRFDAEGVTNTFTSLGGWAMDAQGTIYVAGYSFFETSFADFTTMKIPTQTDNSLPGDINGDGLVDDIDRSLFLAVLLGSDTDPLHVHRSDLSGDENADGNDIQAFVMAMIGE